MGADKRSVSFDPDLAAAIDSAADGEGESFSQWLATAARHRLKIYAGLKAIAEWEAEYGPFTDEEIAEADAILDKAGVGLAGKGALFPMPVVDGGEVPRRATG